MRKIRLAVWIPLVLVVLAVVGLVALHFTPTSSDVVDVTFYNCGQPFPCERIHNPTDRAVTVNLRNVSQHQTVTIPARGTIDLALDERDNQS